MDTLEYLFSYFWAKVSFSENLLVASVKGGEDTGHQFDK